MNYTELKNKLCREIENNLTPLISGKCILTDLPYHGNIGDILIWQGEEDFLASIRVDLMTTSSRKTFTFPKLDPDVTILLHGGGNLGDLWRIAQDFRLKVIAHYPNNRIVMFPQSVWYQDETLIAKDAEIMARHNDLHLCARDKWSYDFMKKHFKNNLLLVPDMAFFINDELLSPYRNRATKGTLYLKRLDKEITGSTPESINNAEQHDWPTFEHRFWPFWMLGKLTGLLTYLDIKLLSRIVNPYIDRIFSHYIKNTFVRQGAEFVASYKNVITSRLHVLILSVLLHKPVEYIDNVSGKLSSYADTWLCEFESVKPYCQ